MYDGVEERASIYITFVKCGPARNVTESYVEISFISSACKRTVHYIYLNAR
jgi:hypothetical protein